MKKFLLSLVFIVFIAILKVNAASIPVQIINGQDVVSNSFVASGNDQTYDNGRIIKTGLVTILLVQSKIDPAATVVYTQNYGNSGWTKHSIMCGPATEIGYSIHHDGWGFKLISNECELTFERQANRQYALVTKYSDAQ